MLEVGELLQCGLQLLVGRIVVLLHLDQLVLQASHANLNYIVLKKSKDITIEMLFRFGGNIRSYEHYML